MTADEFIKNRKLETWYAPFPNDDYNGEVVISTQDCRWAMVEFAKLHVKAALEAAADKCTSLPYTHESIKSAYPLENIK